LETLHPEPTLSFADNPNNKTKNTATENPCH
jgi:hypothetical protein